MLLETLGYQATAAAVSPGTAATAFAGDSLTVKNAMANSRVWVVALWSKNQTLGAQQVVWPSGHDVTRNIRWIGTAANMASGMALGSFAPIKAQELISATIIGTAVAGDIELGYVTLFYEDMPGQAARLITYDEFLSRAGRLTSIAASIDPGAVGGWGGSEAINADIDLLLANQDYAVLGGQAGLQIGAIGMNGPDFGNARVAIPGGVLSPFENAAWFVNLARATGLPCIPVFNSANKGATFFTLSDDENGAATTFQVNLCELR